MDIDKIRFQVQIKYHTTTWWKRGQFNQTHRLCLSSSSRSRAYCYKPHDRLLRLTDDKLTKFRATSNVMYQYEVVSKSLERLSSCLLGDRLEEIDEVSLVVQFPVDHID